MLQHLVSNVDLPVLALILYISSFKRFWLATLYANFKYIATRSNIYMKINKDVLLLVCRSIPKRFRGDLLWLNAGVQCTYSYTFSVPYVLLTCTKLI